MTLPFTSTAPTSDAQARALVRCQLLLVSENPGANQSTVRLIGSVSDNNPSFGGNSIASSWNVTLDGVQRGSGSIAYDFTGNSGRTYTFFDGNFTITHNANGTRSVPVSAFWAGDDGLTGSATASGSPTLTDYNRSPVFSDSAVANTATRGTAYSDGVSASNTSTYSVFSGALPTGLSLNTSTGAITGTPTVVGVFNFVIRANGSFEGTTNTGTLTITVNPALPVFSDDTVDSSARVGIAYSDGVVASEAASYSVFSGALPAGLTLNTSTGAITGTPTTPETATFVIRATNVTGSTNTGTLTITVISAARVWNGTAFVPGLANVWNGTAFVSGIIKVWDGTNWVNTN
jgi:hypothetical protein